MANRNRTAGHAWEREGRRDFIKIGWKDAHTSRYASREMDDLKVDLVRTEPYYMQYKTSAKKIDYIDLLASMPSTRRGSRHMGMINVVADKVTRKVNKIFRTRGKLAVMNYDDFLRIIEQLREVERELKELKSK